jgi:hypothetical protein
MNLVLETLKEVVFKHNVLPSYREDIESFRREYSVLEAGFGISVSNKVHIILHHLAEFVELSGGKGLGEFSEQSLETVHSAFAKVWRLFWTKDIEAGRYMERFLKAVLYFNFLRI